MDSLRNLIDVFVHLDRHLNDWAAQMGPWLYVALFAVVFCETGLVVTPFLPGDSLLFAVGALAQTEGSPIKTGPILPLLITAAILGDAVNYAIGRRFGLGLFKREDSRLFNRRHLERAHRFYERYGGKTIVLARFVPIVRTFAPFVAGMGEMSYRRFAAYNVGGGAAWVALFVGAGAWFGNQPVVKTNFHYVIVGIIAVSLLPVVVEFVRARRAARTSSAPSRP